MKRIVMVAVALSLAAGQAAWGEGRELPRDPGRDARALPPPRGQGSLAPSAGPAERRAKAARAHQDGDARTRYFSPEERRQLRQDLHQAEREIYRRERRHR